jgi:thioredoxin 1
MHAEGFKMDDSEVQSILTAVVQGMIVADHPAEDAAQTLHILSKVVSNALQGSDPKFRRLPITNEKVQKRILAVSGAPEFLDAVGFTRQNGGSGDFVLGEDDSRLAVALTVLEDALSGLPKVAAPAPAVVASAPSSARAKPEADAEYESRRREAEARQAEIRRKMEEDRRQKEALRNKIKAEQKEVRARPIVASRAVHLTRADGSGGAGAGGDGKIRYTNSDREFQSVLAANAVVIANFTASWCGPCQAIAPMVEDMARKNPQIAFIKIDIDENNETPSRFNVTAVPTFILFKNGKPMGEVKGANAGAVQNLVAQAAQA